MSTDRIGFHSTLLPYINHKVAIYSIVNGFKKNPLSTDSLAKLLSDSCYPTFSSLVWLQTPLSPITSTYDHSEFKEVTLLL